MPRIPRAVATAQVVLVLLLGACATPRVAGATVDGAVRRADSLGSTPAILQGERLGDRFGDGIACAGDVDGDGFQDLLVGAYAYAGVATEAGRAYLYPGGPGGVSPAPAWVRGSAHANAQYGRALAGIGDWDGDGYDDVIVGAPRDSVLQEGRAFLYRGGPAGLDTVPAWTGRGLIANVRYGISVTALGDVNGDGHRDVAIGAYNYPGPAGRPGAVFVYYGTGAGWSPAPTLLVGDLDLSWFGYSTGAAGDVNGDGYDDMVVGAVYASNPDTWEGRAYLYLGSAAGIATTPAWVADGENPGAGFGYAVNGAGDVNGDGFADVLVGAHHYDTTLVETLEGTGRAFLYYGSPSGLAAQPSWWITGRNKQAHLGRAVGFAGDVDGDGTDDMYVSILRYWGTQFSEGRLQVFRGHPGTGPSTLEDWGYSPGVQVLALGQVMIANLDLNGDGAVDVAAGTSGPSEDIAPVYGYAYVLYGVPGLLPVPDEPAAATSLAPPWPNPVRPGADASVRFTLARRSHVRLALFDAQGREVARLVDEERGPGTHVVRDLVPAGAARPSAPGLYLLGLESGGVRLSRRLVLLH